MGNTLGEIFKNGLITRHFKTPLHYLYGPPHPHYIEDPCLRCLKALGEPTTVCTGTKGLFFFSFFAVHSFMLRHICPALHLYSCPTLTTSVIIDVSAAAA